MLAKMTAVVADMRVFPERMMKNLDATQGLVFSGQLFARPGGKRHARDDAYKAVQETPWPRGNPTPASANASPKIPRHQISRRQSPRTYFRPAAPSALRRRNLRRVFSEKQSNKTAATKA